MSNTAKKKIGMVTLGCPKNQVDSEVMLGLYDNSGYTLTQDPGEADVIVINTCGFIDEAKTESIDTILEMAAYKEKGNCRALIVAGCLGQRYQEDLLKEIPEIDAIVGTSEFPKIVEISNELTANPSHERLWVQPPEFLYDHTTPRLRITPKHYAYLKIAEGCDHLCSFCVIPKMRGRFKSRSIDDILDEARAMADDGVKEIILIAQDTTYFGHDKGERELARLLHKLGRLGGVEWIRLLYSYPMQFSEAIMDAIASEEKICKYVDLPVQHVSDDILKRMKRRCTGDDIRRTINGLRQRIPGITLRTSLIVGFPGETDRQFDELLQFVEATEFDRLGVFTFSAEEGTPSASMPDQVSQKVMEKRKSAIMKAQKKISRKKLSKLKGTVQRVMVDGLSRETELLLEGRTQGQAPDIDGVVYITEGSAQPGDIVTVKVEKVHDYDLVGPIVN
ncbi:MAG: 30S ribosomal protein S12 methylthiotransferase RimO [Nitrospirota bacterium]|nr:30S ribosomal protein S12 methylthiotransferase RimO [Nitrospirota bacterium]